MPGSWEANHNVLVAILHTDATTFAWSVGLRNLLIPGNHIPAGITGQPFDMARNTACQACINGPFTHLFFLDSDVIAPHNAILRLLQHNLPIVSGVYARRSPPHGVPVMMRAGQWVTNYPQNSLIEVDVLGAGCLLIRRDVLERYPPHRPGKRWFWWAVDQFEVLPKGEAMSEDYVFCLEARRKMGIKIMVDTGVICRHVGNAQSLPGQFVPLDSNSYV